ncbi:MAG: HisA/HisF-related TIM barrel protein [Candidatus Gastranaerophilales bacterium]|nr:HisA/HisF-related TIM barrel protein [Candidatus Gastranaerophilales bacterium]
MEVITAINLLNRQCIDTLDNDYNILPNIDPVEIAKKWNNIGANLIHLSDINGLKELSPLNTDIIKNIIMKIKAPVQIAAGTDNFESFEDLLAIGASRIVLNNEVLHRSDFIKNILENYPDKTVILFNVDSGMTNLNNNYHESIIDITNRLKEQGLQRIIYHDISKNYEFNHDDFLTLAKNVDLSVIASGKLNDISSIKKLKLSSECENMNIEGIILSKALYRNHIDLYEVIKLVGIYPYIGDFYSREDIC